MCPTSCEHTVLYYDRASNRARGERRKKVKELPSKRPDTIMQPLHFSDDREVL